MLIRRADCTTLIEVQLAIAVAVPSSANVRYTDVSLVRMMGQSREDNASITQSSPMIVRVVGSDDRSDNRVYYT